MLADRSRPYLHTSLDGNKLIRSNAVNANLFGVDKINIFEVAGEPFQIKTGVTFTGEAQQVFVAIPPSTPDRIHIKIVTSLSPGEQGSDLIAHGVFKGQHRPDL